MTTWHARKVSHPETRFTTVLVVLRIAAIIFAVEGLLMVAFAALPPGAQILGDDSQWAMALLDAIALVLISSPFVYLWVIRPYALAHARSESELRQSEGRLNEAQRIAHLGSWELDLTANLLTWSDEIYRIFEIDPHEFGASYEAFLDSIHPDDREKVNNAYTGSLCDRTPYAISHRLLMADGRIKWVHERCETDFAADGTPLISRGTVQDITESKLAAEALRAGREQAELANRTKTEFLANMSHELRTPLNAIIGLSEMIRGETFGPVGSPKYCEYVKDINGAGQHLLAMINDILDLSRIETGKLELHESAVDVAAVVRDCISWLETRIEAGGLTLVQRIGEDLPRLRADDRKLKQILTNLLSNAAKFTPAGGRIVLSVEATAEDGFTFIVADSGIGIAARDIPKVLAPFVQVDSSLNRKFDGAGLGLPLTKSLAELHGGSLDLQSEVGAGTTVTVRFPPDRIVARAVAAFSAGRKAKSARSRT